MFGSSADSNKKKKNIDHWKLGTSKMTTAIDAILKKVWWKKAYKHLNTPKTPLKTILHEERDLSR